MNLTEEAVLKWLHKNTSRPLKVSEIVKQLGLPDTRRREFRNLIKKMAAEGSLIKIRGGRYGLPDQMSLVTGILQGHANGFGFVTPDKQTDEPDIYIGRKRMGDAMHLDKVTVRIESGRDPTRPEGRVIRVLEHNTPSLIGIFESAGKEGWVIPKESKYFQDIFIPSKNKNQAKTGQIVLVEITEYPTQSRSPIGRVAEILGYSDDPEVEIQSIFRKHGILRDFSPKVLEEAKNVASEDMPSPSAKRQDLSDWMVFTIDGESAKDFDDAVSLEVMPDGCRLGVHIADVSHYVRENSYLDSEAYDRGTSIYYPDSVIPMLPVSLSNEICSLKPGVKRLTLTAIIDFDKSNAVVNCKIFPSFIVSKQRFTYNQVAHLLKNGDSDGQYEPFLKTLKHMHLLSQILRKRRFKSGSIDFLVPEPEVIMNAKGKVEKIVQAEHNDAHELIEEFMLVANQEVAKFLHEKEIPSIHRIHEPPNEDKLADYRDFIKSFGIKLKAPKSIRSIDLHNLLTKVRGTPEDRTLNTLLLRTMKRARYSESDPGHFALGFKHYVHFTSPIRRYPDLIIHRLVKSFLKRKCSGKDKKTLQKQMTDFAAQSTTMEGKAVAIEREINDLRRAEFMVGKIGKLYNGLITSVTAFGFFVELAEIFVEGLVRVSTLTDDYYIYIETLHKLQGQRRHRNFKIGDRVQVRVQAVDVPLRRIDLTLVKTLKS